MSMSADTGVRQRRRRSPEEAKEEALASARKLLLDQGPDGVTLKAVADHIGMSHGNLIHHFGSAAGLQSALMGAMVRDLTRALESAVTKVRQEDTGPRELVDIVFDAFDSGGAGHLAAWIGLSHDLRQLEAVHAAVDELVGAINDKVVAAGGEAPRHIPSALLFITLCAFGDSVIGQALCEMLSRDRESVRRIAAHLLPTFL
ncbi:MAG TPA: TetR/AcrR family transcriptional regulator [Caulobacteraceae bacterium]